MIGYNDMWTTVPEVAKLLINHEDGYKYTKSSNKKVDWKCPECGNIIKNKTINNVAIFGLSCPKCSDGISYPEKFMYNLLQQLNVDFKYQFSPKWIKPKRYDFYIPSKNLIIEMDGGYGNDHSSYESKEIDMIKDKLAQEHEIEVIRINCNYGHKNKFEYIKNNILTSQLINIFNFVNVDLKLIDCNSYKSIVLEVCKEKHDLPKISVLELSHKYKLHKTTIRRYLKIGNNNGWCTYNKDEEIIEGNAKAIKHNQKCFSKKILCITTGKIYDSCSEAARQLHLSESNISSCCIQKPHHLSTGKLKWKYIN